MFSCSAPSREVYNRTADLAVTSQILDSEDPDTLKVYAHRDKEALRNFVKESWDVGSESSQRTELHELARE